MKRTISFIVSAALLAFIYWRVDLVSVVGVLRQSRLDWLIASLAMVVPLTVLTAQRLQFLTPPSVRLGLGDALRLILSASVLNLVLPSKMGDLAKSVFLRQHGMGGAPAFALVVLEKTCDVLSLLLWCTVGLAQLSEHDATFWMLTGGVAAGMIGGLWLLASPTLVTSLLRALSAMSLGRFRHKAASLELAWRDMQDFFWQDRRRLGAVIGVSLFLWLLHLLQIWMFTLALRSQVPFVANLGLAPLAIFAGLLPLTFAGVGTRDAALILFYQRYMDPATGAALGVLCTSRYLLPAVAGLPFLRRHLEAVGRK